jgi:DNA-binding transcriptional regulator YiaG
MKFFEQVKTERKRLGLTQDEIAQLLDTDLHTIKCWEAGVEPHVLTQEGALMRLLEAGTSDRSPLAVVTQG